MAVAQVSKPAVSPISQSAARARTGGRRVGNPRYSRLGSPRYEVAAQAALGPSVVENPGQGFNANSIRDNSCNSRQSLFLKIPCLTTKQRSNQGRKNQKNFVPLFLCC